METTVEKLEAMFLKSEADLEYIERRLKLEFIKSTAENENPALMLENLRAIKAKHAALCTQVQEIAAEQKESMDSIRNNLGSAMELVQRFQQTTDAEVQPLTELEKESTELLGLAVSETITEIPSTVAASGPQQPPTAPSGQKMKQLKVTVLQRLSLVELDKKGNVWDVAARRHSTCHIDPSHWEGAGRLLSDVVSYS
ncbi:spindle and kinetochore-associated protein 2 isoform X2 [Pungitius pungitius]|uniref:spindle and kinetochore-associated protein 2 isoform X2 n=1 Tax=Pungitius pungitius TaxID=134920 RepID=UPI002E1574AA